MFCDNVLEPQMNAVSIHSGLWEVTYAALSILKSKNIFISKTQEER